MANSPGPDLAGAVALVTGAGRGIGRATALSLAGAGSTVLAVDVDAGAAEDTAAACRAVGVKAEGHRCDVADPSSVATLATDVTARHGALDVLVNNAGVGMSGHFLDSSLDDWRWIRSINLDGVIQCCDAFGRPMVARGRGQVVNLSSGLGYTPRATEIAYVTTKAGVLAFSQCLRADWAPHGVGVSVVCPGVINTPIVDHTRFLGDQASPESVSRVKRGFRRGHPPEQVAAAIVDAIRRNRAVVPVGWEASLGWMLHRLAPIRVQQAIARR